MGTCGHRLLHQRQGYHHRETIARIFLNLAGVECVRRFRYFSPFGRESAFCCPRCVMAWSGRCTESLRQSATAPERQSATRSHGHDSVRRCQVVPTSANSRRRMPSRNTLRRVRGCQDVSTYAATPPERRTATQPRCGPASRPANGRVRKVPEIIPVSVGVCAGPVASADLSGFTGFAP
jgi:hypothetical protein